LLPASWLSFLQSNVPGTLPDRSVNVQNMGFLKIGSINYFLKNIPFFWQKADKHPGNWPLRTIPERSKSVPETFFHDNAVIL